MSMLYNNKTWLFMDGVILWYSCTSHLLYQHLWKKFWAMTSSKKYIIKETVCNGTNQHETAFILTTRDTLWIFPVPTMTFVSTSGHNPLNWFHNLLMGHDSQFEKLCQRAAADCSIAEYVFISLNLLFQKVCFSRLCGLLWFSCIWTLHL